MNTKRHMTTEERFGLNNRLPAFLIGLIIVAITMGVAGEGHRAAAIFIHSAFIGAVLVIKSFQWILCHKGKAQIFHEMVVAAEEMKGYEVIDMAEKLGIGIEANYYDEPNLRLPYHIVKAAKPYDLGTLIATIIHLNETALSDLTSVAGSIWQSHPMHSMFMTSRLDWFKQVVNGVRESRHSELAEGLIKGLHDHLIKREAKEREYLTSNAINAGLDTFGEKGEESATTL